MTARTLLQAIRITLTAAVALICWGTPAQAAPEDAQTPSRFEADGDSRIVSAGGDLWLSTLGGYSASDGGGVDAEVLRYQDGEWIPLPPLSEISIAAATQFAVREQADGGPAIPCLGDSGRPSGSLDSRIQCFEEGRWVTKSVSPAFRGLKLAGLDATGPEFTALFTNWNRPRLPKSKRKPRIALGRIEGDRVVPVGPSLKVGDRFKGSLGQSADGADDVTADVLIQMTAGRKFGKRFLMTLDEARWRRSALPGHSRRNLSSGPVRTAEGVFIGGSERQASRRLPVFRYQSGRWSKIKGLPVDPARLWTDGELFPVGERVWLSSSAMGMGESQPGVFYEYGTPIDGDTGRFDPWLLVSQSRAEMTAVSGIAGYDGLPVFLYEQETGPRWYPRAVVDFSFATPGPLPTSTE